MFLFLFLEDSCVDLFLFLEGAVCSCSCSWRTAVNLFLLLEGAVWTCS